MQVDDLRAALREAAAGQPPVSPTAKRDIRRRVMVRRVAGAALALAVVGAGAGVAVTASGHKSAQGTRLITQPPTTVALTPTHVPVPTPSTVFADHPPTTPVTTPGNAHGLPVPSVVRSVTFISANEGWALVTAECGGPCQVVLAHTTDGGRSWSAVPAPPTTFSIVPFGNGGVWQVRFADRLDGWAYGPELWTTHDGGTHWVKSTIKTVYGLEAGAGIVHAVIFDQATTSFRIESSPVHQDSWTTSGTTIPVGAGPVPSIQLVLSGSSGWIVEVDRTVVAGARLSNGQWQPWTPPCTTVGGPAYLAASDATHLVADCTEGVWTGPAISDHLYVSTDGGSTFTRQAAPLPNYSTVNSVATPAPGVVLVGRGEIIATFDGGRSWQTVYHVPSTLVGFTTPSQGVAITDTNTPPQLVMTRDGGHTWAVVAFR